jgi:hypothetical protein
MKKLFAVLAILLFAAPAFAVDLIWQHTQTTNLATGFKAYSQEKLAGAEVYSYLVPGGETVRKFTIDQTRYQPGKSYDFWVTAYNSSGESAPSNKAVYTRPTFVLTENPPPAIYITIPPGAPVSIEIQ